MFGLKFRSRIDLKQVPGDGFSELPEESEETKNRQPEERINQIISTLSNNNMDIDEFIKEFFSQISNELQICQGAFFLRERGEAFDLLRFRGGFAYNKSPEKTCEYQFGEGLVGQVAKEGTSIRFNSVPEGYMTVLSGLGEASPSALMIFPVKDEDHVLAVVELASFHPFTETDIALAKMLGSSLAPICSRYYLDLIHDTEKEESCEA